MANTVIFIDGEYARKVFKKNGYMLNVPKLIDLTLKKAKVPVESLLRTYLYTSPPFQSTSPTDEEKERTAAFQRFREYLERQGTQRGRS